MSRRKHLLLNSLQQDIEPPSENQHIVRAVGSRGSNIVEVEFPEGRKTLCLLPAKFHKKLWIKRGNYLIVEDYEDADSRVTGQILHVLYSDHVKQLQKMDGIWPDAFNTETSNGNSNNDIAADLQGLSISSKTEEDTSCSEQEGPGSASAGNDGVQEESKDARDGGEYDYSSSDDDLPPIPQIQNRKVVEYHVSDSDSSDDD